MQTECNLTYCSENKILLLCFGGLVLSKKVLLSGNCLTNVVIHIRSVYFIYLAVLLSVIYLSVLQQHLETPDMGLIVVQSVRP